MQSKTDIGFGKKIRAAWLDSALEHTAAGQPFDEVRNALGKEIAASNPGPEAIRKVQTALKRVWFSPPDYCLPLKNDALRLFHKNSSAATRLLLHWGMCISAYPFIGSVAETLGRLLKLQKEARLADVERRIREQHGDRDFVSRITKYDVSSFLDWRVVAETKKRGVYQLVKPIPPHSGEQLAWLVEAVLISRDKTQIPFSELCNHPALFPIALDTLNTSILQSNPRLRVERQSLNQEYVFLVAPPSASSPKSNTPRGKL
jgi:hypothetical protein